MSEKDKLLVKVYEDILQPPAREIGKILGNMTKASRFVFAGFDYLAAKQDRWQNVLKKVIEKVEEENLIEGNPQIVGPIIESMVYTDENTLIGEMFIELLAKSIDKTQQDKAHPAFSLIIKQLCYDEAMILYLLKKQNYQAEMQWDLVGDKIENMRTIKDEFPLAMLDFPNHINMYMNHLNSLTIAGTWKIHWKPLHDNQAYSEGTGVMRREHQGKQTGGLNIYKRSLTDFGELFAQSCVPDEYQTVKETESQKNK